MPPPTVALPSVSSKREDELASTDAYEVDVYARVEAVLESGRKAWVYVGPPARP